MEALGREDERRAMIDPPMQALIVGGTGAAAMSGVIGVVTEYLKRRRSASESRMDDASTADTVSKTYERILRDLRDERKTDREDITLLKAQVAALSARIEKNTSTAREARDRAEASGQRYERNTRLLEKHIAKLSDIMRASGLIPPDSPILEPEPPRQESEELRDAIPALMYGGIAAVGTAAPRDEQQS